MSSFQRLPSDIIPISYELTVAPDLNSNVFDGHVVINLNIKTAAKKIILNSADITFKSVLFEQNGSQRESNKIDIDAIKELLIIEFDEIFQVGNAKLIIKYTGILQDNMKGFYRVKYKHSLAKQPYCATTQFEACDARRAFPCFDEPAFKATFDVIVVAEADKTVLSNMPLKDTQVFEKDDRLRKFIFERTPIMSTYLLAFVVGEYGSISGKLHNGASISVYTPLQKEYMGEFALDISIKTVKFYSEYFGIEYPLPKLDLIAVPENPIEAMENWGLIICNEANMLLDSKDCSFETKLVVSFIITHEIAHQWFGNIVTMEWWSDLWLNEGFATWAAYLATEHCLPEYDIWTNFMYSRTNDAFTLDSLVNTHPIEVPVNDPAEIDEIFDSISYDKGGCVLRMLRDYIGDEAYRVGLHTYLEAFKYSNARTDQLWSFLSDSSKKPVNEFMKTWTQKDGFPYITVEREYNENNELILKLTQNRFFANGNNSINDNTIWKIPITITTKSTYPNTKAQFIFETKTTKYNLGNIDKSDWIILNRDTYALYRTHYETELIELLKNDIKMFTPSDRLIFQNNAFAFAKAGILSITQLFEILKVYVNEENPYVWNDLIKHFLKLASLLVHTDYFDEYRKFTIRLCKPFSAKIGWEIQPNEDIMKSMCREPVFLLLCLLSDEETLNTAKKMYLDFKNGKAISATLKKPIYTAVLLTGDDRVLEDFFQAYEKSDLPEESAIILESLSYINKPSQIDKILEFALSKVTFEDMVIFMPQISRNPCSKYSNQKTWEFLKKYYATLYQRYYKNILLGRLIRPIIEKLNSIDFAEDVKDFFKKNESYGAENAIKQGLENVYVYSMWLSRICSELYTTNYKF